MSEIIQYYDQFDEWGRLDREPIEFQVNWHYIKKYIPKAGNILDNGGGPGKYAMELAKEGYQVTLTDLTPKLVEFARMKAIENGLEKQFNGFFAADARNLHMFKDEQFEAVLMLGPMYHLQEEKARIKAVQELMRFTKKDGMVFVAFMPRTWHILASLVSPEKWKPNDNMYSIYQFFQSGCFNHAEPGRFTGAYYFNIEEIKPFMEKQGFETIGLIGSNVGAILNNDNWDYWRSQGEQEMTRLISFIHERAADPNLLGISSQVLYIGKKH